MKAKYSSLAALILFSALTAAQAQVGFLNIQYDTGDNWIANPLQNGSDTLSTLFTSAPVGSTVALWDSSLNQFGPASTWNGSVWSTDLTLHPGTGALLHTPSAFVNSFSGTALNFDGTPLGGGTLTEPPAYTGPGGTFLFASRAAVALSGDVFDPAQSQYAAFPAILGRGPYDGEQVTMFDAVSQTFLTTTFSAGVWNNGAPSMGVGQAAMFTIHQVPEPGVLALFGIGLGAVVLGRRR